MGILSMGKEKDRYGVIIDIGSGSVLGAIVHSEPGTSHPTVVWSHREHAPLRNIDSMNQSAKAVMAALVNTSIKADSEGRKALYAYDKSAKLTELQVGIAAPWSYTVSKNINYTQEDSFKITKELIDDLTLTAQQQVQEELQQNETISELGLTITTRSVLNLTANGYTVKHPEGEFSTNISLSEATVVVQQYLNNVITEMREKLFPSAETKKLSFILLLHCISNDLLQKPSDVALVDVTYEATEIGIVRDTTLKYCTHTSFGVFSLAREISQAVKVPLQEAFGYLRSKDPYAFTNTLTKQQKEEVERILELYVERISQLFHETGDALAIPKHIVLHTDTESEPLFIDLIEKAAKRATKLTPQITPISSALDKKFHSEDAEIGDIVDTALLLSVQFFHKRNHCLTFDFL